MKDTRDKVIRCSAAVLVFFLLIAVSSPFLKMKNSEDHYSSFYDAERNIDILFLGTSHMMNAISPMQLWHDYGYAACNLAGPGMRIPTCYWVLKNALRYTKPKIIVVDTAFLEDKKTTSNTEYSHIAFDTMPFSLTKIKAIFDLYENNHMRMRLLFPFCIYHNRWDRLTKEDFYSHKNAFFGFDPLFRIRAKEWSGSLVSETVPKLDNYGTQYLERIVQLCKEEKIEVLLTYLPGGAEHSFMDEAAWTSQFAASHMLNYIDPDTLMTVIDKSTDYAYDGHLNYWGALKLTDYIGTYIGDRLETDITDYRETKDADYWNSWYDEYIIDLQSCAESFGFESF